jgi:hypothetical protein
MQKHFRSEAPDPKSCSNRHYPRGQNSETPQVQHLRGLHWRIETGIMTLRVQPKRGEPIGTKGTYFCLLRAVHSGGA